MTLPDERTRALTAAREFLRALANRSIKRVPLDVRKQALNILRHFPLDVDLDQAADASPTIFTKTRNDL